MEQIPTEKDSIIEHMKMINYLKSLYSGKKFFVECYPTDTNAQCFPNSNRAVKEIELPYFKLHDLLTKECEGKEKEIAELKKKWMECFTESALIILKNKAKISELEAEKERLQSLLNK